MRYPYESTPDVMRLVRNFEIEITAQEFKEDCALKGAITLRIKKEFIDSVEIAVSIGQQDNFRIKRYILSS